MNSKELIQSIASRTGLPHDEVRVVLDTLREVVCDQLAIYESCVIPEMMKVGYKAKKGGGFKLHIAPYRKLLYALGRGATQEPERPPVAPK